MAEQLVWIEKDGQFWQIPEKDVARHLEDGFKRSKGPKGEQAAPAAQEPAGEPAAAPKKARTQSKKR